MVIGYNKTNERSGYEKLHTKCDSKCFAERTAKSSVNSASFFTMYQPKEPDALKKDGVDRKKQGNGIF